MQEKIDFLFSLKIKGEKSKTSLKEEFKKEFGSDKDYAASLKAVEKLFKEYFSEKVEELASEIAVHYWDLYSKSYKLQDYRECRAILKELKDLTGTVEAGKANQTQNKPQSKLMAMRKKTG